jgi:hypothetical protein
MVLNQWSGRFKDIQVRTSAVKPAKWTFTWMAGLVLACPMVALFHSKSRRLRAD